VQKSPGINEYEQTPLTSPEFSKKPLSGLFGKAKPPFADIDGEDEVFLLLLIGMPNDKRIAME
jgi:hypothetical protein